MNLTWLRRTALTCVTVLLAASCGGGVGTGGTGSFASGAISGFGSVIVNDIVFDDSSARVEDGDGGSHSRAELRLGMTVEIDSDAIRGGAASATRVRYDSALVGPLDSVDAVAGTFTLLGQSVAVDSATVFDDSLSGRLAALRAGVTVEVYGLFDPVGQRYRATRVEARSSPSVWRLRGLVTQVDAAAQTLRIGGAVLAYAGAAGIPSNLAAGQFVRLTLRAQALGGNRWQVLAFSTGVREVADLDGVVVKGLVSAFTSASSFSVDGRTVDASAASFVGGAPALGQRVEVEGAVRSGVLRARTVTIKTDAAELEHGFRIRAAIDSVNIAQRTFVVRGVTFSTSRPDLRIDNGTLADLFGTDANAVGRPVDVTGLLSGNGTVIDATRIRFE